MYTKFVKDWDFCSVILVTLIFIALLIDIVWGQWNHDGGYYLVVSQWIYDGKKPYIDFPLHYPPLQLFLNTIPMYLGLSRYWLPVIIPMGWVIAISGLSFLILKKWIGNSIIAILASCSFILLNIENQGNTVMLEHGVVFFALVGIGILQLEIRPEVKSVLIGLSIILATLCKQSALLFTPLLTLVYLQKNHKFYISRLILAFLFLILMGLIFLRSDILTVYESLTRGLINNVKTHNEVNFSFLYNDYFRSKTTLLMIALCLLSLFLHKKNTQWGKALKVSLILTLCLVLSFRVIRNYYHYNLMLWPVVLISLGLIDYDKYLKPLKRTLYLLNLGYLFFFFYTVRTNNLIWRDQSIFFELFTPVARKIEEMVPEGTPFLQVGEENILEFLAHRKQSGQVVWETPYDEIPITDKVIVVSNHGQPGLNDWIKKIESKNYHQVFKVNLSRSNFFEITVYQLLSP